MRSAEVIIGVYQEFGENPKQSISTVKGTNAALATEIMIWEGAVSRRNLSQDIGRIVWRLGFVGKAKLLFLCGKCVYEVCPYEKIDR